MFGKKAFKDASEDSQPSLLTYERVKQACCMMKDGLSKQSCSFITFTYVLQYFQILGLFVISYCGCCRSSSSLKATSLSVPTLLGDLEPLKDFLTIEISYWLQFNTGPSGWKYCSDDCTALLLWSKRADVKHYEHLWSSGRGGCW